MERKVISDRKKRLGSVSGLLLVWLLTSIGTCKMPSPVVLQESLAGQKAKNVILIIGDGMGLSQISAALYSNNNKLSLEQFPVIGFQKTHSSDDLITDSAASATAFACGVKTYNGAIGVNADTVPCQTILELLDTKGYATGMVVTSTIVHATPAAFIAHRPMRVQYEDIALDFLDTEIDLMIGGGKRYFDRRDNDERDLYQELVQKGYAVSDYSAELLEDIRINSKQNFVYFTADKHPITAAAGRDYLPFATEKALDFLERHSEKGFFLMIEGSQIDWGGHSNDANILIEEALDLNKAIKLVYQFASKRDDTLVIVTADHETGGTAINPDSKMGKLNLAFTTNGHTASMVPVFAFGPSAYLFSGIYDNTEIYHKMLQALDMEHHLSAR
ncbi:MAG TPA: alkaline phosphatase [Saprospiraceae bacterium]|nr:alkaline phosphatase [Saprospiraceae bacterium]HMQ84822.1 alkaline phosphatase [Saprospiraceae bacterium]